MFFSAPDYIAIFIYKDLHYRAMLKENTYSSEPFILHSGVISIMSIKSNLVKIVIKLTPNVLIVWVANFILKGIAELLAFNFDVDARTLYVQTRLYGENDTIEVVLEDFAVFNDGDSYRFIIHHARSDRAWLNNLLSRVIGKAWKIPALPQFAAQMDLVAELFKAKPVELPVEPQYSEERVE